MTPTDNFSRAFSFTVGTPIGTGWEGGKVDHHADRGGRTAYGVIQTTYDGWRKAQGLAPRDVWLIGPDEVKAIYRTRFWHRVRGDELPWPLCLAVFDTGVLHGTGYAIKRLQQTLNLTQDGLFGPITLRIMQRATQGGPLTLTRRFLQLRDDRYEEIVEGNPSQRVFYRGWERRCDALCDACGVERTVDPKARPA